MLEETSIYFGPFCLDLANESLGQGQEAVKLTRKGLSVLRYLVEHAGQLVTKGQKSKLTSPQPLAPNTQGEVEQEAEGYFLKAIEIARKQQAKSLELRAVMSLARLWQSQGKQREAHQMLSEVYG